MLALESLLRSDYVSPDQIVSHCSQCLVNLYTDSTGKTKSKARKVSESHCNRKFEKKTEYLIK